MISIRTAAVQAPLLLSCKLTNAALKFLERRGEDLEPLYERFDWPLHYLRDSSSWLEADRLEYVLKTLNELFGKRVEAETGVDFFSAVGHASPGLRAWGALDSVLKIVPGVRDLYHQPDRFLASFISPQPQIQGLQHTDENVVFRIGFSDDRMPHTARYLRAVLESLPEFIGKPRTHVLWNHGHVSIEWSERQVPFVSHAVTANNEGPSLSPDLLRTILVDLATAQRDLESTRRQLQEKELVIQGLQTQALQSSAQALATAQAAVEASAQVSGQVSGPTAALSSSTALSPKVVEQALYEIYKLGDYFARAQQIVTLLRAPRAPMSPLQADALIKRTAWDRVSGEAPLAIRNAAMLLRGESVPGLDARPKDANLAGAESGTPLASATAPLTLSASALGASALAAKGSLKTPSFFDQAKPSS